MITITIGVFLDSSTEVGKGTAAYLIERDGILRGEDAVGYEGMSVSQIILSTMLMSLEELPDGCCLTFVADGFLPDRQAVSDSLISDCIAAASRHESVTLISGDNVLEVSEGFLSEL